MKLHSNFLSIRSVKKTLLASFMLATSFCQAETVDILVLYDDYSKNKLGGDPETAMIGWINDMNSGLRNSQVDMQFRLVGVRHHEPSGDESKAVLNSITYGSRSNAIRDELGADIVSQLHKTGSCGRGWTGFKAKYAWNVSGPQCGPLTMLHEFGHNMGLNHSRRQGNDSGTVYRYGLGYGVDGIFSSLMAYPSKFGTRNRENRFSNPNIKCQNLPCGIPAGDANQAFAAKAVHNVRKTVASWRSSASRNEPVKVSRHCDYNGHTVGLPEGRYTLNDLLALGILNNDISSLRVESGYEVKLYQGSSFTGSVLTRTEDDNCLVNNGFNDETSSLVVSAVNNSFRLTTQAEEYSYQSGVYTQSTSDQGGGENVGWISSGDWMAYQSITIPESDTYNVEYRIASPNGNAKLSLDLNAGSIQLGTLDIPNTGGWQNWETISHEVTIKAGTYNVGIFAPVGGWNINWWRISR